MAEGQEFAKELRSLEQFMQTVKSQYNFLEQKAFLTCSWKFFRSITLEQIGKNKWGLETYKKSLKKN